LPKCEITIGQRAQNLLLLLHRNLNLLKVLWSERQVNSQKEILLNLLLFQTQTQLQQIQQKQ